MPSNFTSDASMLLWPAGIIVIGLYATLAQRLHYKRMWCSQPSVWFISGLIGTSISLGGFMESVIQEWLISATVSMSLMIQTIAVSVTLMVLSIEFRSPYGSPRAGNRPAPPTNESLSAQVVEVTVLPEAHTIDGLV